MLFPFECLIFARISYTPTFDTVKDFYFKFTWLCNFESAFSIGLVAVTTTNALAKAETAETEMLFRSRGLPRFNQSLKYVNDTSWATDPGEIEFKQLLSTAIF